MPPDWEIDSRKIIPSPLYKGLLYCPPCQAHYPPNQEWGYPHYVGTESHARSWTGIHKKGAECPRCGRKPE